MDNGFNGWNWNTEDGKPDGGVAYGSGFSISWQKGPLRHDGHENPQNGAFVETVLCACLSRLEYYQTSQFRCEENQQAIDHINVALAALRRRTDRRVDAGVEGTWEGN